MNSTNFTNLKLSLKKYFAKMLMLLPLTFLFTPFFYCFLGYHPDTPNYALLVYLWHALFIYLGMTFALILKKYAYLAYPIIAIIAFLCRNVGEIPALKLNQTMMISYGENGEEFITGLPLTPYQLAYFSVIVFITAMVAGFAGIVYAKKTALEFVNKGSTFLFINIFVISAAYYFISGIMDIDRSAVYVFVFYLAAFAVSYFMVRNFASLNRQIEVYGESGAYNATGTHKIYVYYFIILLCLSVIPIIICFIIVPYIVNIFETVINFIMAGIFGLILLSKGPPEPTESDYIPDPTGVGHIPDNSVGNNDLIYYIFLAIVLLVAIIFRKQFIKLIKWIVEFFSTRSKLSNLDKNNIINKEIIVKVRRDKKLNMTYKNYLKKAKKIRSLVERYLFAYNCIFWNIIRLEEDLNESMTPEEVALYIRIQNSAVNPDNYVKYGKYKDVENLTYPYEDIKYGDIVSINEIEQRRDNLRNMINTAENLLQKIL